MGTGFLVQRGGSGSGGSINFQIVNGTTRPSKPSEGMVWVNTIVPITDYVLSATQPENPTEGMVWIKISDSSSIEIGTQVAKDYITIMLNSVSQYVNGAWMDKDAKSYQGGVWVDWWDGQLYTLGYEYTQVTGGWTTNGYKAASSSVAVVAGTKESDRIKLVGDTSTLVMYGTDVPVDLSEYSELCMRCKPTSTAGSGQSVGIAIVETKSYVNLDNCPGKSEATNSLTEQTVRIPLDGLNEKYYILIYASLSPLCKGEVYEIYLIK